MEARSQTVDQRSCCFPRRDRPRQDLSPNLHYHQQRKVHEGMYRKCDTKTPAHLYLTSTSFKAVQQVSTKIAAIAVPGSGTLSP